MVICCYEDRVGELLGVKLMVRSVRRHLPGVRLHLCIPNAPPDFQAWVARQPDVHLDQARDATLDGWNAKPLMLLRLLDAGAREAIWLDSDLIVTGDFRRLLVDDGSVVGTEERCPDPRKATSLRTAAWGLAVGRKLPHLINTAFMRALPAHRELLTEWARLMRTPEYQAAQKIPFQERPIHLISDQDVLTALLGAAAFAAIPMHVLRRGRDIIHDPEGGYHPVHRLANLFRAATPLVHSQSARLWNHRTPPRPSRGARSHATEGRTRAIASLQLQSFAEWSSPVPRLPDASSRPVR